MSARAKGSRLVGPLVSGEWVAAHLADVRVVDVRWYLDGRSGLDAYLGGHLPGAVWLDVDTDLSAPASPAAGRHPLPTPEQFAAVLGRVGIADGTPVVAYDDAGGSNAARLWWLLHVLGEPAAVLDGGLAAWPGRVVTDVSEARRSRGGRARGRRTGSSMRTRPRPAAPSCTTRGPRLATRTATRAIDPRPGQVPGALSAPWAANLDATGRLRGPSELRELYADAVERGAIAYCGSGVTACLDLLAMELAGMSKIALYPGSWSQWGANPARPAQPGSAP